MGLSICTALGLAFSVFAAAPTFNDVHRAHPAYEAIMFAADPDNGAFMVGDARGNFNPRRTMSMFEASRVFALAAGFRHAPDFSRRDSQARALAIWGPFLSLMAGEHSRWNPSFDAEIAYLLELGVFTVDDVRGFVEHGWPGESHAALTAGAAAVFTRRVAELAGREPVRPDSPASETAVTRAELAAMLYGALHVPAEDGLPPWATGYVADIPFDFVQEARMEEAFVSGRLESIDYHAINSITVRSANGSESSFFVPSNVRDISTLDVGMLVAARVQGSRAISVGVWGYASH